MVKFGLILTVQLLSLLSPVAVAVQVDGPQLFEETDNSGQLSTGQSGDIAESGSVNETAERANEIVVPNVVHQINLDGAEPNDGVDLTTTMQKTPAYGNEEPSNQTIIDLVEDQSERTTPNDRLEFDGPQPTTTEIGNEPPTTSKPLAKECKNTDCFHDGVCRVMEDGTEKCFCTDGYWGARCQLRNICKTIIADNQTGDQICEQIGRFCIIDDKLFRCQCDANEYFVFKANHYLQQARNGNKQRKQSDADRTAFPSSKPDDTSNSHQPELSTFVYDALIASANQRQQQQQQQHEPKGGGFEGQTYYLAECRQVDKCLGVRCRQHSEVCDQGRCECNRNLGYIRDPSDNLCKLLNACNLATASGKPICGEAKCLPTYNRELYKCVCPIGYYAVQPGPSRSSIKCAILEYYPTSSIICLVPLLNKCQHNCLIHNNSYKCSCFDGYRPGSRPGIDDHLCFFKEYIGLGPEANDDQDYDYDVELVEPNYNGRAPVPARLRRQIVFEPLALNENSARPMERSAPEVPHRQLVKMTITNQQVAAGRSREKRSIQLGQDERRVQGDAEDDRNRNKLQLDELIDEPQPGDEPQSGQHFLSAQERCNMYCDENKICVLEDEATGIYRCHCDRQGYVSVGDKCLDWCAASEFSHNVRFLLDLTCATGLCKRRHGDKRPPSNQLSNYYNRADFLENHSKQEQELIRLESRSSWRPTFQCDCSSSPLVFEDANSRLCRLNFSAILEPCLPGNEGHTDCVVNKHAYCAVLHKDPLLHNRGLTSGQLMEQMINQAENRAKGGGGGASGSDHQSSGQKYQSAKTGSTTSAGGSGGAPNAGPTGSNGGGVGGSSLGSASGKKVKQARDKPYVCVCSPDKKFLVDKPRNKARCVDECDLLNNECGRFNRMCRAATISSNDQFGSTDSTLVHEEQDGIRMSQFKRTGCECLPGFNVGPSEPRDFTLDTNYPEDEGQETPNGTNGSGGQAGACSRNCNGNLADGSAKPYRFGWDLLESLLQDASHLIQNPPRVDQSLIQNEFVAVGQDIEHLRTRYMNINSRCLLDYDVVEFHARFKAPANFEPSWVNWTSGKRREEVKRVPSLEKSAQILSNTTETSDTLPSKTNNSETKFETPMSRQASSPRQHNKLMGLDKLLTDDFNANQLKVPEFMQVDMADFHKHIVLVADCDFLISQKSFQAYEQCVRYRYWIAQKFRAHFADWRQVISERLRETFDLMDGNIRFRVNKCESVIKRVTSLPDAYAQSKAQSEAIKSIVESARIDGQSTGDNLRTTTTTTGQEQGSRLRTSSSSSSQPNEGLGENADETNVLEEEQEVGDFDPWDQFARVDADLDCKLTIHSASDYDALGARKNSKRVLLEKQLPKFIFELDSLNLDTLEVNPSKRSSGRAPEALGSAKGPDYYVMAPNTLIHHESYDQLAAHRKAFSPCNSEYSYCDKQTRCEMQDTVNYSCTCEAGYTPIGSRDIYFRDSRKEVCEDINECLFDVCKGNGLEDKSICVNEIGDYKCQCIRHHVGDNKRFCDHICNVIACKHGDCRIPDEHHAFCECYEGYREADCSVQDPSVALRKANMIICGSIFASVLLLAITLAISLNSQLKKTKKKLKRLEAAQEAVEFYEFSLQQPPYRHRVSKASIAS